MGGPARRAAESARAAQRAIESDPDDPWAIFVAGYVGDYVEGLRACGRGIDRGDRPQPEAPPSRTRLSELSTATEDCQRMACIILRSLRD